LKNFGEYLSSEELIRNMVVNYLNERFICYPEKVVKVYDLNHNILSLLPNIWNVRKVM